MPRTKSLNGHYQIQVGNSTIPYEVIYAKRKTLTIHVYPDPRVVVKAPKNVSLTHIESVVLQRANWILRHLQKFRQSPVLRLPTPRYLEGETHWYLGKEYTLRIVEAQKEGVELAGHLLIVHVKDTADTKRIARLVDGWFRKQAEQIFQERLAVCFPRLEWLNLPYPVMTIRNMRSRWGSCSSKGKVTLNLKLVYLSLDLIDYVVLHELCHLKEMNHSPAFYALMTQVLPDWKAKRKRLHQILLS